MKERQFVIIDEAPEDNDIRARILEGLAAAPRVVLL